MQSGSFATDGFLLFPKNGVIGKFGLSGPGPGWGNLPITRLFRQYGRIISGLSVIRPELGILLSIFPAAHSQ